MFVSSLGLVLSMFWVVLGLRQLKFHTLLELQLAEDLKQLSETEKKTHVIARLYELRKSESPLTIGQSVLQLTRIEYMASSRWFLVFVPLAFGIAYVAFIFASVYILKCIT